MHLLLFLVLLSRLFAAQIQLGKENLDVEIADTHESRARGLMGRTELRDGEWMLFVYEHSKRLVFWMRETLLPLSIGFFDETQTLLQILDMDPPIGENYIRYRSRAPAKYALEVPQGWFEKHKIHPGDKFSFLKPSNPIE